MPTLCRTERREGDTASKRKKMETDSEEEIIFGNQEKAFQGTCFFNRAQVPQAKDEWDSNIHLLPGWRRVLPL